MARLARIAIVNTPHHVTQRGNGRQSILESDNERLVYLELLRHCAHLRGLTLLGYCLMSNHVHLLVVPQREDSLALALKDCHGRYATFWNAQRHSTGHVWQGRFYSCPLDDAHLWIALRYVELNPVRAGLVARAEGWPWSSATAHFQTLDAEPWLDTTLWRKRWSRESWRRYLSSGENDDELRAIRSCTHTGRPLGSREYVRKLEESTSRLLEPQKGGRPRKSSVSRDQGKLDFTADDTTAT
ncbi:MAG TPA: transposase [Terriglobales bacterium]|nr:transposase [Terriglobales bacterium]